MTNREIDRAVAEKVMGWNYSNGISFHPFSNISDAWQVVEKMREKGSSVDINWGEDTNIWEVSWISGGKRYSGYSQSPTEAICLAALKALGVEVRP